MGSLLVMHLWFALDNAYQLVGHAHFALLHHLKVLDDTQGGVGCDDRELVELLGCEEHVGYLHDALLAHLLALEVVSDGHRSVHLLKMQQIDYLEYLL